MRDDHWYGIRPNGNAYTVHWYSLLPDGRVCYVPADGTAYGFHFGVEEPFEECVKKAKIASHGEYDIVIYDREYIESSDSLYVYRYKEVKRISKEEIQIGDYDKKVQP